MPKVPMPRSTPHHISVVAVANSTASTLFGIYDVLAYVQHQTQASTGSAALQVEIVGEAKGPLALASGVTVEVQRAIGTIDASDILIVPSVHFGPDGWRSEEHTSELQSRRDLVCRLLLEKKKKKKTCTM